MGCFDERSGAKEVLPEHKFEFINLQDFTSTSFVNCTAYVWLYLSVLIALLSVAADTYTGITLLVFNRWSSQIKPIIPFEIAKIIFAVCILLSYILLVVDWGFAVKIIRRGGVADAYMDGIALRWHSICGGGWWGEERDTGWRRFLVFARLTEKRSGGEYVALFTYFSFKGWARVLFAEGPRVVINTFTLISVVEADLLPDKTDSTPALAKFFQNVKHLYDENKVQVLILSTMTFTTVIWLFTILQLLLACLFYTCYLVRTTAGQSLRAFCKDRVDKRLGSIVVENHKVGTRKELRQPTLPVVGGKAEGSTGMECGEIARDGIQSSPSTTTTSSPAEAGYGGWLGVSRAPTTTSSTTSWGANTPFDSTATLVRSLSDPERPPPVLRFPVGTEYGPYPQQRHPQAYPGPPPYQQRGESYGYGGGNGCWQQQQEWGYTNDQVAQGGYYPREPVSRSLTAPPTRGEYEWHGTTGAIHGAEFNGRRF